MAIPENKLMSILLNNFPDAQIKITDTLGDQDHYLVEIESDQFKGLPLIKQHRLVKDALSDVLSKELHAVSIKTKSKL
ncbi:MAG: BolA family transcriptional regulator [Rickettsiales bacterium]|nr:BolA family transcriptional regulator [Rickettsiales bacterium]